MRRFGVDAGFVDVGVGGVATLAVVPIEFAPVAGGVAAAIGQHRAVAVEEEGLLAVAAVVARNRMTTLYIALFVADLVRRTAEHDGLAAQRRRRQSNHLEFPANVVRLEGGVQRVMLSLYLIVPDARIRSIVFANVHHPIFDSFVLS